jgi:hypothetical protein
MPVHNAMRRATELLRGSKLAFGLDSQSGGLERLSESLQLVADILEKPEWQYLIGRRKFCTARAVAAAGANYATVSMRLPASANMLCIIPPGLTVCDHTAIAGSAIEVGSSTYAAMTAFTPNAATPAPHDTRMRALTSITEARWGNPAATVGSTIGYLQCGSAGFPALQHFPLILTPGNSFYWFALGQNKPYEFNIPFIERELLPGELSA